MRSLILFAIIFLLNSFVVFTCDDCDAFQYQLYSITNLSQSGMCEYKTRAMTDCAIWRKNHEIVFIDKCGKYGMSQYFRKTYLDAQYPK
jgi:hypothetical protein